MPTTQLRLKELRGKLSQKEAADKAGISQQQWSKLERGILDPDDSSSPAKIARAFGISLDDLLHGTFNAQPGPELRSFRPVPIVGDFRGGLENGYFEDREYPVGHGEGFIDWPTRDPNAYAARIVGDSMAPRIRHGEFVIVEPNAACRPGNDVVVKLRDGHKMCKRLLLDRADSFELGSINDAHKTLVVLKETVESIQLVAGIVSAASPFVRSSPT